MAIQRQAAINKARNHSTKACSIEAIGSTQRLKLKPLNYAQLFLFPKHRTRLHLTVKISLK